MQLDEVLIQNFRGYHRETKITLHTLTAIIGKNDSGKTTILDALGIFFENKLSRYDTSDKCVYAAEEEDVRITCIFSDLPSELVLDTTATTSLQQEFLLDESGRLRIVKIFKKGKGNGAYFLKCAHPSNPAIRGLINKKNSELKELARIAGIQSADKRSNVSLRRALYENQHHLELESQEISLSAEDGKAVFEQIKEHLPIFALFRADRPNTDEEAEVQDPMKMAIANAIEKASAQIAIVRTLVEEESIAVANATLKELATIDPALATTLKADFRSEPKWESVFKMTLIGDNEIPINKRGSGIRRLVLISFFKAEVERLTRENAKRGVIYAIEEPETSQHPDKQQLLIKALNEMADTKNCQILFTTHVPALIEQVPCVSLRYITRDKDGDISVEENDPTMYARIAGDLGVLPDGRVKIIICVEGPSDIEFLKNIASALREKGMDVPDLTNDPRIVMLPLGGDTLRDWVNRKYLARLSKPEIHIYDRDTQVPPKYQGSCDQVNTRKDGSIAFLTSKREVENYLHPQAIKEALGVEAEFTDNCDVPQIYAPLLNIREGKVKKRLAAKATRKMTPELLQQRDPKGEMLSWFQAIADLINNSRGTLEN